MAYHPTVANARVTNPLHSIVVITYVFGVCSQHIRNCRFRVLRHVHNLFLYSHISMDHQCGVKLKCYHVWLRVINLSHKSNGSLIIASSKNKHVHLILIIDVVQPHTRTHALERTLHEIVIEECKRYFCSSAIAVSIVRTYKNCMQKIEWRGGKLPHIPADIGFRINSSLSHLFCRLRQKSKEFEISDLTRTSQQKWLFINYDYFSKKSNFHFQTQRRKILPVNDQYWLNKHWVESETYIVHV